MAVFGTREPQACPTCGRTWDHCAAFCGACGDRLAGSLLGPRRTRDDTTTRTTPRWWHHPATGWTALAAIVATVAITVPTVTVERTDPVAGDIGVPESEQLTAVDADDPLVPPPEPPDLTCEHHGEPVDCILWSRAVAGTPPDLADTTVEVVGDHVVVAAQDGMHALDLATGRRVWEVETGPAFGRMTSDGAGGLLLRRSGTVERWDVATGRRQWAVDTRAGLSGMQVDGDVVYTNVSGVGAGENRGPSVVARSIADGSELWQWRLPDDATHRDVVLGPMPQGTVLVVQYTAGLVLTALDGRTGRELWTRRTAGQVWGATDDVVVTARQRELVGGPSQPNLAGDPGAIFTAIDVADGTVRWEHAVRAMDAPIVVQRTALVAPSTGRVTVIDLDSGEARWEVATAEREFPALLPWRHGAPRAPRPDSDHVVTIGAESGTLRVRDVGTGDLVWERDTNALGSGSATVVGDHVVVSHGRGVDVVDLATGRPRVEVAGTQLAVVAVRDAMLLDPRTGYLVRIGPTAGRGAG